MTEKELLQKLTEINAIITNSHVVYTSGKHGSAYINKDAIYPHTELTSHLCKRIATEFSKNNIEAVLAPVIGGVILSQWIAFHLTQLTRREVLGVYAEKSGENFVIKRGYDNLIRNKNILVVEDVMTTGGSVKKVIDAARLLNTNIVGVGAICNRGGISIEDLGNIPKIYSLINIKLDMWDEQNCELCQKHIPINTSIGKGREYLALLKK